LPAPAQATAQAATPSGNGTVTNDPSTQLPPEAAALGARVAAGVPAFLSQPSSALAGLWHHGADAAMHDLDALSRSRVGRLQWGGPRRRRRACRLSCS
jgi:hypothetical protein